MTWGRGAPIRQNRQGTFIIPAFPAWTARLPFGIGAPSTASVPGSSHWECQVSLLYSKTTLGPLQLQNRLVMCPLTRSRAIGNVPNDLMAEYYAQRATAGMIITEGTSPSPNGLGYARIPGLFNADQVRGWKLVRDAGA